MKSEVNIFYVDDTGKELEPEFFDYFVTRDSTTKKTIVTIGTDVKDDKILGVSLTLTKERWFEIVQGVQKVLEDWEKEQK